MHFLFKTKHPFWVFFTFPLCTWVDLCKSQVFFLHLLRRLFELSILLAETLAKIPWEENCPLCCFEIWLSFFLELGSGKFILPLRDILGGFCPFWCLGSRAQIHILYLLPSYNLCNFPANIRNYAFPSCSFDRILVLHLEKTASPIPIV